MISRGKALAVPLSEIKSRISESEILYHYFGITNIPCVINSPLREDRNPSFGLFSPDGEHICYKDLSTGEHGDLFSLLKSYWNLNFQDTLNRIYKDIIENNYKLHTTIKTKRKRLPITTETKLEVKTREWRDYDLEYWNSYGITLKWLTWADIYPISHIFFTKNNQRYVFPAEKLAYCFVEHKEGNTTIKVYQPLVQDKSKKWFNKHDRSVISLWTKIPEYGKRVVICSSMKDALCLSANTGIPAISIQGEGYSISETAINELTCRFTKQYVLLDNDETGIKDSFKLSLHTGFTELILPKFNGGKDVSDYYKLFGKEAFIQMIKNLFKDE